MLELIVTVFILQEIDRKEARINAMRCAILETFPEPNRRLLQRCSLSLLSPHKPNTPPTQPPKIGRAHV